MEAAELVPAFMTIRETGRAGHLSVTDGMSVSSEPALVRNHGFRAVSATAQALAVQAPDIPVTSSVPESGRKLCVTTGECSLVCDLLRDWNLIGN